MQSADLLTAVHVAEVLSQLDAGGRAPSFMATFADSSLPSIAQSLGTAAVWEERAQTLFHSEMDKKVLNAWSPQFPPVKKPRLSNSNTSSRCFALGDPQNGWLPFGLPWNTLPTEIPTGVQQELGHPWQTVVILWMD